MINYFFLIPVLVSFSLFDLLPVNAAYKYIPYSKSKNLLKNSTGNNPKIPNNTPERGPDNEYFFDGQFDDQITVGLIHSLSGTMAISESTLVDAEILAIEEINEAG